MYCPNCGKANSTEQKFCRACGLSLEKVVESLVEQRHAAPQNQNLKERQRKVDLWLNIVGVSAVSIVVVSVLYGIIYKIIIEKGEVLQGSIFLTFIVGIIVFALLAIYRSSLDKAAGTPAAQESGSIKDVDTAKLLPDSMIEPLPSVTERTTELLLVEKSLNNENE